MLTEQRYCEKCGFVHWVEVQTIRHGTDTRVVCRGEMFGPFANEKKIVKRSGRGFKLVRKSKAGKLPPQDVIIQDEDHTRILVEF